MVKRCQTDSAGMQEHDEGKIGQELSVHKFNQAIKVADDDAHFPGEPGIDACLKQQQSDPQHEKVFPFRILRQNADDERGIDKGREYFKEDDRQGCQDGNDNIFHARGSL